MSQYQNIDATLSTNQYGMKVGLKVLGKPGLQPWPVKSEFKEKKMWES